MAQEAEGRRMARREKRRLTNENQINWQALEHKVGYKLIEQYLPCSGRTNSFQPRILYQF
jgi:hypothetical protein